MVCIGGDSTLEVLVQNVADGSKIQIQLLDENGKKVGSISGEVYSGIHRSKYVVPDTKSTILLFTCKLPAHGLEATGSRIQVLPVIAFGKCQHYGPDGSELQQVSTESGVRSTWSVSGAPKGAPVQFDLLCRMPGAQEIPVWKGSGIADSGKTEVIWSPTLPKAEKFVPHAHEKEPVGEKYESPVFRLQANCLGAVGITEPIPYVSWVDWNMGSQKGEVDVLFPDGRTETMPIPDDGLLRVKGPMAGQAEIVATRLQPAEPSRPSEEEAS